MTEKILDSVETVFEVEFDDCHDAEIVYNAVKPEVSFARGERSSSEIELKDNVISIKIVSHDIVSLRASINSYVRWIKLSTEILKI
ncbi:MAG: hypothetical protein BZ138_04735 [Methanosphaera sp. rholeuAM270]|nr:MAG: hypothetical protein BZ138_04735 [Methanosphaera sp. rholeuAM270]